MSGLQTVSNVSAVTLSDVFTIKHVSALRPSARVPLTGIEWSTSLNQQGAQVESEKVPFDGTVFAGTRQVVGPIYSISQGYQFDMNCFPGADMEEKTRAFNNLVAKCGLVYKRGLEEGKPITSANPRNARDPFISSDEFKMEFDEFEGSFDYTEPINQLRYAFMKKDDRFLVIENSDEIPDADSISYRVEYIVSRRSFNQEAEIKGSVSLRNALVKLEALDMKLLKTIAMIWEITFDQNTTERMLRDQIGFRITEKKKMPNSNQTYLQNFTELVNLDNKRLGVKALIQEAVNSQVLRITKQGYSLGNTHLGMDLQEVEVYLNANTEESNNTLFALQSRLESGLKDKDS